MPGPKMGPRPADFDEAVIRQSPTFLKWMALEFGQKLRYACRDFVKGQGDDEERLMRRIMIARRNNVRDHEALKRARTITNANNQTPPATKKQRRISNGLTDSEVAKEMDVKAVEATRSYKAWMELDPGKEFVYNQRYIKGKENHDWLLKKNIWRRMRYRRENKQLVERAKGNLVAPTAVNTGSVDPGAVDTGVVAAAAAAALIADINGTIGTDATVKCDDTNDDDKILKQPGVSQPITSVQDQPPPPAPLGTTTTPPDGGAPAMAAADVVDHALLASAAASASDANTAGSEDFVNKAVVEAAVAAADSYIKDQESNHPLTVNGTNTDPTNNDNAHTANDNSTISTIAAMTVQNPLALDAAAKLAAANTGEDNDDNEAVAAAAAAAVKTDFVTPDPTVQDNVVVAVDTADNAAVTTNGGDDNGGEGKGEGEGDAEDKGHGNTTDHLREV